METLISKFNTIQDQFRVLREDPIEFPQIVVVGIQSAGKSSVLEAIVRQSFLPRGTGMVTRCPLVLQLTNCLLDDPIRHSKGTTDLVEWGEFLHAGSRIFQMGELRKEIEMHTIRLAGVNKNISHEKITLKVYSPKVPNLTLVDLPGITKLPVEGQPADIETQIYDLVNSYIKNPLSLILAVVPANMDMATNDGLKVAKQADPDGSRTLAVVTKLDLMDKGTNADDILAGRVIPVKLGIIGVVNRSQQEIKDEKSIEDMLDKEREFLMTNYPTMLSSCGTPHLTQELSNLLLAHIKNSLPRVKTRVKNEIKKCETDLKSCGDVIEDKKKFLSRILSDFCIQFCKCLEGGQPKEESSKLLIGGAQICHLFGRLHKTITGVEPCETYSQERVTLMIRNASGPRPPFLVSEQVFEDLIKPLIEKFRDPSRDCLKSVMTELKNVFEEMFPVEVSLRFPQIKNKVGEILDDVFLENSSKAEEMVEAAIDIEFGHITYGQFQDLLEMEVQGKEDENDDLSESLPFERNPKYALALKQKVQTGVLDGIETEDRLEEILALSTNDVKHMVLLGEMLVRYYRMVSEKVADTIAKTIMHYLVNAVKRFMHTELVEGMFQADVMDSLFEEDSRIEKTRRDTEDKLKVLKNVDRVLQTIV